MDRYTRIVDDFISNGRLQNMHAELNADIRALFGGSASTRFLNTVFLCDLGVLTPGMRANSQDQRISALVAVLWGALNGQSANVVASTSSWTDEQLILGCFGEALYGDNFRNSMSEVSYEREPLARKIVAKIRTLPGYTPELELALIAGLLKWPEGFSVRYILALLKSSSEASTLAQILDFLQDEATVGKSVKALEVLSSLTSEDADALAALLLGPITTE